MTLSPTFTERLPIVASLPVTESGRTPEVMAAFERFHAPIDGYIAPAVHTEDHVAPGPHGDIPVRVYRPAGGARVHGLVWAHGGAFLGGDLDMPESDVVARELAVRGIVVVAVDYRLCVDGVHFPVPHDDVHAAFLWASTASGLLDADGTWAIGGGSAGGNLAAGVAQRVAIERPGLVDAAWLAYPVLHLPLPAASAELQQRLDTLPASLIMSPRGQEFINANFLGDHGPDTPYAYAGHGDLRTFPRTLLSLPDHDGLTASGAQFARQLAAAGREVEVEDVPGSLHAHLNIPGLPEALASLDTAAAFLRTSRGG